MAYTTIKKPSDYFNTVLYSGNNSTNAITGVNFSPDLLWLKPRNAVNSHRFIDQVRGGGFGLASNNTAAEYSTGSNFTSFDSDGFTVAGSDDGWNQTGINYVAWNWLASNTTASNTDGSITSTVSANTTSGFSIVSYTGNGTAGATVGHGLGVTPKFMIIKNRDSGSENFCSYHVSLGATKTQKFTTSAAQTLSSIWNDTEPTSSVFTIGNDGAVNVSGNKQIVYCFAEKQGFSKFGSYTGNGNADGTFVYTGFKPAFLITKRTDTSGFNWYIWDIARNTYNPIDSVFYADTSDVETDFSLYPHDLTSNGFKIRTSNSAFNASGGTYIYMAFAEEPLVGDNPATAR